MTTRKVCARVKRSRIVRTFAELSHANRILLENAEQERDGWSDECLTTIVIAAFKFEAYLNHVGKALFPSSWQKMERLSHAHKRKAICTHLGIAETSGTRPWHTVSDLFTFRNSVATWKIRNP